MELDRKAEEQLQVRFQVLQVHRFSRREQEGAHIRAQPFSRKDDYALDRPCVDVLNRRRNLFLSRSLHALVLALDPQAPAVLRISQDDIDLPLSSPDPPAHLELRVRLQAKRACERYDFLNELVPT